MGDAEGERFLSLELADRCQEASESAGSATLAWRTVLAQPLSRQWIGVCR